MSSILKVTKLHFMSVYIPQIIMCSSVLLLQTLISVAFIELAHAHGSAGVNDLIAVFWIAILGLIIFPPSFKYLISQGYSRKKYFVAMSASVAVLAGIFTLLVTIFYLVNLTFAKVWMIYEVIYRDHNIFSLMIWEFAVLFFLGALGWFVSMIYYVSGRITRLIVSAAPFVIGPLLVLFNELADGAIAHAIGRFLSAVMGLSFSTPNPYIGIASMIAAAVILGGPIFLLLRRAQVKD